MQKQVDVAIVGGGTAGMAAFRAARKAGATALIVEERAFGTTCARTGCMPSKLLIAAARVAAEARRSRERGIEAAVRIDGAKVFAHLRAARDAFVAGVLEEVRSFGPEATRLGRARFVSPHELAVEDDRIMARAVVLATGSRPKVPKVLASLGDRLFTDETIFELSAVPSSLAVLGAGPIGLELGQAFARLGARVFVVDERPTLALLSDPEVEAEARLALGRELNLRWSTKVLEARREREGVTLVLEDPRGHRHEEHIEAVLAAVGREPAFGELGLDRLGLPWNDGAPVVDAATLQWGSAPIFLAGDVTAQHPVLHEATRDGRLAGANAARFPEVEAGPPRVPLSIVFTDPVLATVGAKASTLPAKGVVTGTVRYESQGRAKVDGHPYGMLRVYADEASGRLLGAEIAVAEGEHLAHWVALALHASLDVGTARRAPFYHPTLEEGLQRALAEACNARGQRTPEDDGQSLDCLR